MPDWLPNRLPEDIESERSLLATCCAPGMENRASEIVFQLSDADFVAPQHKILFLALRELLQTETEVNALTLRDCLVQRDQLGSVGGFAGLTELMAAEEVGRPEVLAGILRRKTGFRSLVKIGARLVRESADELETPETLGQAIGQEILDVIQGRGRTRGLAPVERAASSAMSNLQDRMAGEETGVFTGFPSLDRFTSGFKPGQLIVLAARPGVGKSTLAQNWAYRAARSGVRSTFFTLEMSEEELFLRFAADHGNISHQAITSPRVDDAMLARLMVARTALEEMPLLLCDRASITVPEIRAQVVNAGMRGGRVGLVVVDYLGLISSPKTSKAAQQNEAVRIGEISRGLKLMAKDLRVPVVVLCQLNREVEHRTGGKPQLSDLRDSGAIEQDADMVGFIHRRMSHGEDGHPSIDAEFILAKHRGGPTGSFNLQFDGDHCRYRESDRTTSSSPLPPVAAGRFDPLDLM